MWMKIGHEKQKQRQKKTPPFERISANPAPRRSSPLLPGEIDKAPVRYRLVFGDLKSAAAL
jgi:hypothetical protein